MDDHQVGKHAFLTVDRLPEWTFPRSCSLCSDKFHDLSSEWPDVCVNAWCVEPDRQLNNTIFPVGATEICAKSDTKEETLRGSVSIRLCHVCLRTRIRANPKSARLDANRNGAPMAPRTRQDQKGSEASETTAAGLSTRC